MNTTIETLNGLGERLYSLGWPILWQSSLLIVIVFCLDYLLAKKVRAAVRYALWLAVLVKLLLPPTLALPTGVAWWLTPAKPVAPPPVARHYTVTYGETVPLPDYELPSVPLPPPPPPKLELSGWLLLAATAVSAILLLWLMVRWWQVARMVRRASPPEEFSRPLADALRLAGAPVRLKMVDGRMSPAVCGLFRPVILLPRELAEKLSAGQLRAVLLHELFHLRRGDVWVNCAQALLQIVYWWHPLLWFANARIRRLREEAVDDAVMLALRDEADSYAPTLLEVAKLALRRPLLSLGLVGIMESRSALRQRIERLVDFRAPRKAGLTLASFLAICAFSAVALPMGEAPAVEHPDNNAGILHEPTNAVVSSGRGENKIVLPAISAPATVTMVSSMPTNQPAVIIQGEFYRMRQSDFEKLVSDPAFIASKRDKVENLRQFNQLLKASGFQPISRPRIQTFDGMPAELYVGNETNSIEFECSPGVTNGLVDLASRIKIISPAENTTTTNELSNRTVLESGGGHVFSIKTGDASSGSNLVVVTIGVQIVTNAAGFHQRLHTVINRPGDNNSTATNVTVGAVSNMLNDPNFRYVIHALEQRSGVEFLAEPEVVTRSGRGVNSISMPGISVPLPQTNTAQLTGADKPPMLFSRVFAVDSRTFLPNLDKAGFKTNSTGPSQTIKDFFSSLGVDLQSTPGKAVFYNDRLGKLFIKATETDLDTIERAIEVLNDQPPQIHIKAQFVSVPKGFLNNWKIHVVGTNGNPEMLTGILSWTNTQALSLALVKNKYAESLAEPEVTTVSGRHTQMKATTIQTIVTKYAVHPDQTGTNTITPETEQIETGPIIDIVPYVLSDGYTINLVVIPSLTEFLGYDTPPAAPAQAAAMTNSIKLPAILPRFRVRQVAATLNIWDGQTAIITGLPEKDYMKGKATPPNSSRTDRDILVLITATIVDPAGNRVHQDADLPFAQTGVPPQPPQPAPAK